MQEPKLRVDVPVVVTISLALLAAGNATAAEWTLRPPVTTEHLNGVWLAADGSGGVAVGNAGTTLHLSDNGWVALPSSTEKDLFDVYGTSANDVVASGRGRILHFDGADWTTIFDHFPVLPPGSVAPESAPEDLDDPFAPVWIEGPGGSRVWFGAPKTSAGGFDVVFLLDRITGFVIGHVTPGSVLDFCGEGDNFRFVTTTGDIWLIDANLQTTPLYEPPALYSFTAARFSDTCDVVLAINQEGIDSYDIAVFEDGDWSDQNTGIPDELFSITPARNGEAYAAGRDYQGLGVVWSKRLSNTWNLETHAPVPGLIDIDSTGETIEATGELGTGLDGTMTTIFTDGFESGDISFWWN